MTSPICCCRGSDPANSYCPGWPSDASSRVYSITIPQLLPLIKGRYPAEDAAPHNHGICASNSTHPGWGIGRCDLHTVMYDYQPFFDPCGGQDISYDEHCWNAYGPFYLSTPQTTITLRRSDFDYSPNGSAQKFFTDNSTYQLQANFNHCTYRCAIDTGDNVCTGATNPPVYANRTDLIISVNFFATHTPTICANGTSREVSALSAYQLLYVSDQFNLSGMFGATFRLKKFLVTEGNYCGGDYGWSTRCVCTNEILSGYPTMTQVPQTIQIVRVS